MDWRIDTLKQEVAKINLAPFTDFVEKSEYWDYLTQKTGEHYQLLAHISMQYSSRVIYEIGTHYGASSVALTYNPEVYLFSYDIKHLLRMSKRPLNCTYCLGDFREDPYLLDAPFIFVDVDPHDGQQEREFHEFFMRNAYKGAVLWDDIHLNDEMQKWWDSIQDPNIAKHDLTEVGHASGTGLLIYS